MKKTLFVDTNIFLSLYSYSDDDLRQFRSLFILSQEAEIDFVLSQQVIDEFWRNRDAKIAEAIERLKSKDTYALPALVRDLDEAKELARLQKELNFRRKALVELVVERSRFDALAADLLIKEIFEKSEVIEVSNEILERAKRRVAIGNPPGKSGSLGDAINWECILTKIGFLDTLCFVSRDQDYASKLHPVAFNQFLRKELDDKHLAEVTFYPSLKSFIEEEFPATVIEAFASLEDAVEALEASSSSTDVTDAIELLFAHERFSTRQIKRLISAAESNDHIRSMLNIPVVYRFYVNLESEHSEFLEKQWANRLLDLVDTSNYGPQHID